MEEKKQLSERAIRQEQRVLERLHLKDLKSQGWKGAKIVYAADGWPVVYCGKDKYGEYWYSRGADLLVTSLEDAA